MKLRIVVKPNARQTKVEPLEGKSYRISVTVPPVEGKANEAVVEALSEHFGAAKSRFRIVAGHKGRTKIVEYA
ncbi:MAG: DUF167 domain-containing protein [Nitrospirae bacterium]|nr:DUF167 domain-containing protein [Nitrospirota bacterium]